MANNNPNSLYDFVLQQMAAESYFDTPEFQIPGGYKNKNAVMHQLTLGTNREGDKYKDAAASPNADAYPGLTRMTKAQAEEFFKNFEIIHQWSDFPDGARPTKNGTAGGYIELNGQ